MFISKCLKDKLWEWEESWRGSQGGKALLLGLKVDLAAPLGGCCTALKKWMLIKRAMTNVGERLNCLVKKEACGMRGGGSLWPELKVLIAKTNITTLQTK